MAKSPTRIIPDITAPVRAQNSSVFFDDFDAALAATSARGRKGVLLYKEHAEALIAADGKGYFIIRKAAVSEASARSYVKKLNEHFQPEGWAFSAKKFNSPDPRLDEQGNRRDAWTIGDIMVVCERLTN